ncbi:MAG: hypothetical protein N3A65_07450 [candidate division WOR-3 bacterium]|nr:hypothetical protein [candidate division WOR-3 bacterium]
MIRCNILYFLLFFIFHHNHGSYAYAPEDSNYQYLLDKQLSHYFQNWEIVFDSTRNGMRTSQGCLDLLNWYINLELRYEAYLSKILGIRYQNRYLGDYDNHISNHYFQPFFQLSGNERLFLSITTHYYKGKDEIGIGYYHGKGYLNFSEIFLLVENFDRNFSLQDMTNGRQKVIYKGLNYPIKLKTIINRNWSKGRLRLEIELARKYIMESTDEPSTFREAGYRHTGFFRFWQDAGNFRFGFLNEFKISYLEILDSTRKIAENIFDGMPELQITYLKNHRWLPNLYLTYNYKTVSDSVFYKRNVFAYLIDIVYKPGGNFIWHFGTQRNFYQNNQGVKIKERRINVGLEYHYKNLWFYLVEAMEGDFPTPKYLHNHTYVQLMLCF